MKPLKIIIILVIAIIMANCNKSADSKKNNEKMSMSKTHGVIGEF